MNTIYATTLLEAQMTFAYGYKLPLAAVLVCCVSVLTLLIIPDYGKCVMTYMWPNYFSLSELVGLGDRYDLYIYREGRHSLKNARKVHASLSPVANTAALDS